jgi:hypothetical protein
MSVTDIIDSYFSGEKLESTWIVLAGALANFGHYRLAYAVAALLALVFVFLIGRPVFHGPAVGLLILAALGYTIDFFAEERAREYQRGVANTGAIAVPADS